MLFTFLFIHISLFATSQTVLDTVFQSNAVLKLENLNDAESFLLNGKVEFKSQKAIVRVVLTLQDGRELLVFESYPLISESESFSFNNACEETETFSNGNPINLKIQIEDAELFLYDYNTTILKSSKIVSSNQKRKAKIDLINANLRKQGALWIAGETSVSKLSYSDKKKLFNAPNMPNINGLEYYKGGIINLKMYSDDTSVNDTLKISEQYIPLTSSFSYIDLHGANDPNSPYFNKDTSELGWITSIKNQGSAGSCWAFATIASMEAAVNLYYNQHLNVDLSEQQLISCSKQGSIFGGYPRNAMMWIAKNGIVGEECFPYEPKDIDSSLICNNPQQTYKPEGIAGFYYHELNNYESALKQLLINHSPIAISIANWTHSILLVGYKTFQVGDDEDYLTYLTALNPPNNIFIASTSYLVGETCWKFKNSWGEDWGDHGYMDLVFDDYSEIIGVVPAGKLRSKNMTDNDVACWDKDGDGFYNWGIGERPKECPNNLLPDGDDSDPFYGPRDDYGNLTLIGDLAKLSINGSEVINSSGIFTLNNLPNGASFLHWSYSNNLMSDDYYSKELKVTVGKDQGLASISAYFSYLSKKYKITKIVATKPKNIVFIEKGNLLPPAGPAAFAVADFDLDEDYDLVFSGVCEGEKSDPYGWGNYYLSCFFDNCNGFIRDTSLISYRGSRSPLLDVNDFNNDMIPDLSFIATNFKDKDINYQWVFNSKGTKFFDDVVDLTPYRITATKDNKLSWIDIDNNGVLDFTYGSEYLYVSGLDSKNAVGYVTEDWSVKKKFDCADFDNDGEIEVVSIPDGFHNSNKYDSGLVADSAFLTLYEFDKINNSLLASASVRIDIPDIEYTYHDNGYLESADFNNDGFLDVVVSYYLAKEKILGEGSLCVYLNNQNNEFIPKPVVHEAVLPVGLIAANIEVGDFTNDGFNDIIYTGYLKSELFQSKVFLLENDGQGNFTPILLNIGGVAQTSSLKCADFDNDNKLDFLISGGNISFNAATNKTEIMINKSTIPSMNFPDIPNGLVLIDSIPDEYIFNWDKLAEGGYSYNFKLGTTPGGGEIVSCNALENGKLTTPKMGNAGLGGMYILKRDLPIGNYYWTVQAVDNAFRGGNFAEIQKFRINISDSITDQIILLPNPASDYVFIECDQQLMGTVEVLNIQGKLVKSQNLKESNNKLDVRELPNGLYFCRLNRISKVTSYKFLINR